MAHECRRGPEDVLRPPLGPAAWGLRMRCSFRSRSPRRSFEAGAPGSNGWIGLPCPTYSQPGGLGMAAYRTTSAAPTSALGLLGVALFSCHLVKGGREGRLGQAGHPSQVWVLRSQRRYVGFEKRGPPRLRRLPWGLSEPLRCPAFI